MKYSYRTEGTCCQAFDIETEDGKIKDVQFYGGCNGNLQGICSLIKGMPIGDVIGKLQGIRCGSKPTSCPDQLSRALSLIVEKETGKNRGKETRNSKKAMGNQLGWFPIAFLPIKGLSLHPGVKTLPSEEERAGAYCLGIGGKRLAVEG